MVTVFNFGLNQMALNYGYSITADHTLKNEPVLALVHTPKLPVKSNRYYIVCTGAFLALTYFEFY